MMPLSGLQISPQPRVTLNFDLLTHKVDRFMPLFSGTLVPTGIKIGSFVFQIYVVFKSLVTNEQTK